MTSRASIGSRPAAASPSCSIDDFVEPNGLCFSPDETLLYINDTTRAQIRVFDVQGDGSIANGRVLAEGVGSGDLDRGDLADGMKVDERGNVWVTGTGGVMVFDPDGQHLGTVEVPENVGNINWGGPDWSWLFIAASHVAVPREVQGIRQPSVLHEVST